MGDNSGSGKGDGVSGDIRSHFTQVAPDLPVYAAPTAAASLTEAEKKILATAPVTLLLTPADILVKKPDGAVDRDASGRKLTDTLKTFYPDYTLTKNNRDQMIDTFIQMEKSPQAVNYPMSGNVCMVEMNPGARTPSGQSTGVPDSYFRPERLELIKKSFREFTVGHELGHCRDGRAEPMPLNATLPAYTQTLAREASADRQSIKSLETLDDKTLPDKREALQAIMDERAISTMLNSSNHYQSGSLSLDVNDHATVGLLLRPDASPVTALLAPALANRSIDTLIGRVDYVESLKKHPDIYGALMQMDPETRQGTIADHGASEAEKNPLIHYAAAKALLNSGSFGQGSLARLEVERYVEAMERNLDPNLIEHEKADIARFESALQAMKPAERAQLDVTVASEAAATQEALKDPDNAYAPPGWKAANMPAKAGG